jgi:hypothetical protein
VIDVDEIMEHIVTVKEEKLKRLDDDFDILKAYLKMHAPKTAIEALEGPDCRAARELEESRGPNTEAAGGNTEAAGGID